MKKTLKLIAAASMACACSGAVSLENGDELILDSWSLSREGTIEVYDVKVPSTVAGVLCDMGYFGEDILNGEGYYDVDKSIFDDAWIYTTSFELDLKEGQNYDLVFNGLNYYADIVLNGTQIAASDTTYGVFIKREYNVTDLLQKDNTLEVKIRRAQPRDLNIGFVDWNPRPYDESMGITQTVKLCASASVSIQDVYVIPSLDTETFAEADLEVRVTLKNNADALVTGEIALDLQDAGVCNVPYELQAGEETILVVTPEQAANLHVENPRVWWTYDLGTPELYNLNVAVTADGKVSDKFDVISLPLRVNCL